MSGDGGFSMLMGDFLTLVQYGLPVKVVLFDNSSLGTPQRPVHPAEDHRRDGQRLRPVGGTDGAGGRRGPDGPDGPLRPARHPAALTAPCSANELTGGEITGGPA